MKKINQIIEDHKKALCEFEKKSDILAEASLTIVSALKNGKKILLCGNGGSAADCQHFAAELTGRFQKERKGLAALALTTDTSAITSISNDYSFEDVFSRQVEALGREGDVLIAFSTSGNSKNILKAAAKAKEINMKVFSLTGAGGKISSYSDICLSFDEKVTARIQEMHSLAVHILCELIEDSF
ncbi:MAG: D-sedoheptulose 7-phosphate isomerase [Elusimicrobiota bacterium]